LLKKSTQTLAVTRASSGAANSASSGGSSNHRTLSSQTSFGFASLEHEYSVVSHTPIFSTLVSKLLLDGRGTAKKLLLDMTFGSGGHANLLLKHSSGMVDRIVVCDCDRLAYSEAKELRARNPDRVIPLKSRFHNLPNLLLDNGFTPGSFDGILIDTGCSTYQWEDSARGFCPNKAGNLDLRYEPAPSVPTASEVLQNITDKDLLGLIKAYSGLGPNMSKYVANAIVEARYLFHKFLTTQELYEVIRSAARTYCMEKESTINYKKEIRFDDVTHESVNYASDVTRKKGKGQMVLDEKVIARKMMRETLTALQLFVNNDVNELHFAVNNVARNFLKPETGVLVAIVSSDAETRVMESSLREADLSRSQPAIVSESGTKSWLPWQLLHDQPLPQAEKLLYPRLQNAKLYAALLNEW